MGPESSTDPGATADVFLQSLRTDTNAAEFPKAEAGKALAVFLQRIQNWHWEDRPGRIPGPTFRLKTTTEGGTGGSGISIAKGEADAGGTEVEFRGTGVTNRGCSGWVRRRRAG